MGSSSNSYKPFLYEILEGFAEVCGMSCKGQRQDMLFVSRTIYSTPPTAV